jgi:GGDEF domain-containing protein
LVIEPPGRIESLAKAARYGVGFGLCCLGVDRLNTINDSYGHPIGDLALKRVAAEVQAAIPADAVFGRLGGREQVPCRGAEGPAERDLSPCGDEFAILLNACSRQDAEDILEQVIANLATKGSAKLELCATGDDQPVRVSLSAGLLYVKPSNQLQPLDALLSAADKLMYSAKQAGGNQVAVRVV